MIILKRIKFRLGYSDNVGLSMGFLSLLHEGERKRGLREFQDNAYGHYQIPVMREEEMELDKLCLNI